MQSIYVNWIIDCNRFLGVIQQFSLTIYLALERTTHLDNSYEKKLS